LLSIGQEGSKEGTLWHEKEADLENFTEAGFDRTEGQVLALEEIFS